MKSLQQSLEAYALPTPHFFRETSTLNDPKRPFRGFQGGYIQDPTRRKAKSGEAKAGEAKPKKISKQAEGLGGMLAAEP